MKIREIYWERNFLQGENKKWILKIQVYASDEEIDVLRTLETKEIIKKLFGELI
jgi:hypothetical protein